MSKNILSYFTVLKKQTAKVADDDSDVIPESPEVQVKKKKQSKKKRRIEDSDEEIVSPKKKKADTGSTSQSKHNQKSPKLKEIPITDLFGTSKIKKTESLVVKDKKTETGIHSDEEFEQSLLELDGIESYQNNKTESDKIVPKINEISLLSATKSIESSEKLKTHDKSKLNPKNHGPIVNSNNEKLNDVLVIDDDAKSHISTKSHKKSSPNKSETENSKKKRNLSEFLEDEHEQSFKKQKHNVSLNDSALSDQDRHDRKRMSAELYQRYLNRTGPKHLGAKQIPEGSPDCLKDCAFLLTGVLDSFERDEIVEAITKYGGTVKNGVSKKVTHVLAGEDAGPAKTAKAEALGIKIINEDQFLSMITELSNNRQKNDKSKERDRKSEKDKLNVQIKKETVSPNRKIKNKEKNCDEKKMTHENYVKVKKEIEKHSDKTDINDISKNNHERTEKNKDIVKEKSAERGNNDMKNLIKEQKSLSKVEDKLKKDFHSKMKKEDKTESLDTVDAGLVDTTNAGSLMWVDKYKPENIKQIIGQHGDASNVKKLMNWLTKWYVNRKAKLSKPNPWAKNDDGGFYKAALLSGPPGVGKTTTVSLVCKELGFDMVEFNASDTRSRNLIKEQISELLSSTSLSAYAKGVTGKQAVTKKHVLVMDEVDGMAGNEDRGGLQELISLIKTTLVPVICMCNDRNSEKMRSLVNYCYDLRFSRPRVDQIKAAMMRICFKEGVKVSPDVLTQLIIASGQDIRQTLHLLSVLTADVNVAEHDKMQREAQRIKKDIKMGPWDAIRKVFSAEEHKTMSIIDRSDLFFADYSLAPLFVHENYLQVVPHCPKKEILYRMSKAVDSISLGDLVDSRIRSNQAWSLLPLQAMYSSVIPGQELSGHMGGQIQFPGWLGKNSRANKMARLAQTIHAHTRLSTSGSKSSIFLDYASHLRDAILNPLIEDKNEGISKSLQVLEEYHLLRDDLDSLTELSLWPGQRNPNVLIDAKVKAAMTRTYNKQASALPYAPGAIKKAKHQESDENYENDDEDVENDSDPENDALIKKKKAKDVEKPSSSKEKPQTSKGKGKKTK